MSIKVLLKQQPRKNINGSSNLFMKCMMQSILQHGFFYIEDFKLELLSPYSTATLYVPNHPSNLILIASAPYLQKCPQSVSIWLQSVSVLVLCFGSTCRVGYIATALEPRRYAQHDVNLCWLSSWYLCTFYKELEGFKMQT